MIAQRKMDYAKIESVREEYAHEYRTLSQDDDIQQRNEVEEFTQEEYARLLQIMTPTSRYLSASGMPGFFYAGFPRWVSFCAELNVSIISSQRFGELESNLDL